LARAGHSVVVVTRAHADAPDDDEVGGVRVIRVPVDIPWLPEDDDVAVVASANHHLVAALSHLRHFEPDVVHAHDWNTAWAGNVSARVLGVPLVTTIHATERGRHGGHVPQGPPAAVNAVEWWSAMTSTRVVCLSRFMAREIVEGFELDPAQVRLVPNGVEVRDWVPPDPAPTRDAHVMSWGRVQYEKGFQVLAQAMARVRGRVPGVRCTIAGRGPYLPELQSQVDIEGVGDLVNLAGYVPDDELRTSLHRAGCVVIPSLYEPFGVVALEALAAGAPVVAARTGGLAETLDGTGAALLFEPGNAARLAEAIETVLSDTSVRAELATRGRDLLHDRFSWDAIAATTAGVYSEARLA
jgi:glycogen(starch) synthase